MQYFNENDMDIMLTDGISPRLSLVREGSNGGVTGFLLSRPLDNGDLEISYLLNDSEDDTPYDIIAEFSRRLMSAGMEDKNIIFTDESGRMAGFAGYLTHEDEDMYRVRGLRRAVKLY